MNIIEFLGELGITGRDVLSGGGAVILLLLTLIQFSPVKFNPWSWVAKKLGYALNRDLYAKIDRLEKDIKDIKDKTEEREATECRGGILRFGDEILHGVRHSKEHFDQILMDISFYEHYCETHPNYSNNVALMTIKKIKDTYRECMDEDKFL